MNKSLSLVIIQVVLLAATYAAATDVSSTQRIEACRREKEATLKSEHGILSFVGSYRLNEGESLVGSSALDEIRLPVDSAPAQIGQFVLRNRHVTFTSLQSVPVTLDGKAVSTVELNPKESHAPVKLVVGRLLLIYFTNDQEHTVLVSDPRSPNIANFGGLDWYPVDPNWRTTGKFVSRQSAWRIIYENALGGRNSADSPGHVVFTNEAREYQLDVERGPHGLTALFSDDTSGTSTFGGGRSLEIQRGEGDALILDFNQSVNKPCAVSPFTACSLAPAQNRLTLKVTAGEKIPRTRVERVKAAPERIR